MQSAMYFYVRGTVQGVGFRMFVLRTAEGLELAGWVRNLPDGGVEGWAEGRMSSIHGMIQALRQGPPASVVADVTVRPEAPTALSGFQIRR